ncbi:E3 ubiquitin-protein ligase RING1-like [Linum grandiflorum]
MSVYDLGNWGPVRFQPNPELPESERIINGAADKIRNRVASESAITKLERLEKYKDDGSCPICWEEMAGRGRVIRLECNHIFDESCLLSWLHISASCPLCRSLVSV